MRRRIIALTVVAGAALLSGCGGAIAPDELARSIETLESTAAEGSLLAEDVAGDRTAADALSRLSEEAGKLADGL